MISANNKASLFVLSSLSLILPNSGKTQDPTAAALQTIKPQLEAIYEQGQYRPKAFRAEWLPDSSGYVIRERLPGTNRSVWTQVDAATGNRTEAAGWNSKKTQERENRSPDGQRTLITERGNLSVGGPNGEAPKKLTHQPDDGSVTNSRAIWSPDGKRVAFVQSDRTGIRKRAMLRPGDPSYPTVGETRFARVGGKIAQLKVGVVEIASGEINWLPIPMAPEGIYLGQVEWAGNSHEILVEKLNRFRNERTFLLVDIRSNSVRTLFHESDPAWVVASYGTNAGLEWIHQGQAFIVLSEKDGWRHAYLCSRDSKEERLLTPGDFDIIKRVKVDEERGWYYFSASPDNGSQQYLYRVPLTGHALPTRVTPLHHSGTHDYDFSPDAHWAFHTFSSFDHPPITELVEFPSHRTIRTLEANRELRRKINNEIHQPTEFLKLNIGGGVEMDAWMIKPNDFDPSLKYPVLVYVYGEPHAQTVLDAWGKVHAHYHRAVANLGYLVVSIDNRGTPAPKGAAWRRAVFGSLGPLSTEEQAKGLKELARSRSYVDSTRVGIWGWSGGGSNTLNALFRRPDVYHMGMAVAPKPQAHLYNAWFQEIYMETRETNPEGYTKASAINFAEGLQGDLLIIHGSGETNTHIEIVEGLVDRLIELGKPFDYMVYPNRDHGIRKGAGTSVHLRMHMVRYLLNHLDPGPS